MSNEIAVSCRVSAKKGNLDKSSIAKQTRFDMTNARGPNPGSVSLTTSETDIDFGDLTAPGWFVLKNLSTTASVIVGPKSAGSLVPFLRLPPGGSAHGFFEPSITVTAKTVSGTADLNVEAYDT